LAHTIQDAGQAATNRSTVAKSTSRPPEKKAEGNAHRNASIYYSWLQYIQLLRHFYDFCFLMSTLVFSQDAS
jgi:hypothetical protein